MSLENTKMQRLIVSFFFALAMQGFFLCAQISFEKLDLNSSDGLLFSSVVKNASFSWENLYSVKLDARSDAFDATVQAPKLLTCFPQKMDSLQGGKFLQIRNADGVFIYTAASGTLQCVSSTPSLYPLAGSVVRVRDNLMETAVSPDGNWICLFKKKDSIFASIVLCSTKTGKEFVLVEKTDFSLADIPVRWSPDSKILIYEKNNRLYFIEPTDAFDPALPEEKFRSIGEGGIACVRWASQKKLMYMQGDLIFSIFTNELYTRALYSAVLGVGRIAGRLPWCFDSRNDFFWTDETGSRFVIVQAGKNIFYFDLEHEDSFYNSAFLPVSDVSSAFTVFWSAQTQSEDSVGRIKDLPKTVPIVWVEYFSANGEKKSSVYVLKSLQKTFDVAAQFARLPVPPAALKPEISPDGTKIAFCADGNLFVYSPDTWEAEACYSDEKVISFAWCTSSSLYVGGKETVRLWNTADGTKNVLFLSDAGNFVWDASGTDVLSSVSAGTFKYNAASNTWLQTSSAVERQRQHMNSRWRMLFEQKNSGFYKNFLFARALQGPSRNLPLFDGFFRKNPPPPKGKVALAFDALDRKENVPCILNALSARNLNLTFFINGEFMRRYPEAVAAISSEGHECASMFYTNADLLSEDFIVDEAFIRRGLARNEDEFYALTGNDLKLFWHAPYCRHSPLIEKAGKMAGYTLVDKVICPDRSAEGSFSSEHISEICSKLSDGVVVLLPCKSTDACHNASLYDKLEVLVNAILEVGYDIVSVSQLVY